MPSLKSDIDTDSSKSTNKSEVASSVAYKKPIDLATLTINLTASNGDNYTTTTEVLSVRKLSGLGLDHMYRVDDTDNLTIDLNDCGLTNPQLKDLVEYINATCRPPVVTVKTHGSIAGHLMITTCIDDVAVDVRDMGMRNGINLTHPILMLASATYVYLDNCTYIKTTHGIYSMSREGSEVHIELVPDLELTLGHSAISYKSSTKTWNLDVSQLLDTIHKTA